MAFEFLVINGHRVPVANGKATRRSLYKGVKDDSARGRARDGSRAHVRAYDAELIVQTEDDSTALANLVHGRFHVFPFDDGFQSSTSIGPEPGYVAWLDADGGRFSGCLVVAADETISFDCQVTDDWTVSWMRRTSGVIGWTHYAMRSDGAKFVNGVVGASFAGIVDVAAGVVTLHGVAPSDESPEESCFDDLAVFPWLVTDKMIASFHALEEPMGQSPFLHVRGDAIEEPLGIEVSGIVHDSAFDQSGSVGNWRNADLRVVAELIQTKRVVGRDTAPPLPAGYWPLDADAFITSHHADIVVAANLGTEASGTTAAALGPDGLTGHARRFGGTAYVAIPDSALLETHVGVHGAFSWACWMNPLNLGAAQSPFAKWASGAEAWRALLATNGSMRITFYDSGTEELRADLPATTFAAGTWHHLAFTYDRDASPIVRLWLDGIERAITIADVGGFDAMVDTSQGHSIGAEGDGTHPFTGDLAHPMYFSSVLLNDQIRHIYLTTKRGQRARRV